MAVEDRVWIAADLAVLPGVTVARGCVIEAGAIVSRDCAPGGLYAGAPAKRIKDLSTHEGDRGQEVQLAKT